MKEYPIDRKTFETWLVIHYRDIVGTPTRPQRCPVARFIQATMPLTHVNVGSRDWHAETGVVEHQSGRKEGV